MTHMVTCRLCRKKFDAEKVQFVLVGQKSYYHKRCYDEWKNNLNAKGEMLPDFWYEAMIDYLYRDVKMAIDFSKIQSQWANFIKPGRGFTPKGIFFAVKYFYEVQHGDCSKAVGGIGIVPSIYSQAAQYWTERETQKAGTIDAIIAQIKSRADRPIQRIIRKEPETPKTKWDLNQF